MLQLKKIFIFSILLLLFSNALHGIHTTFHLGLEDGDANSIRGTLTISPTHGYSATPNQAKILEVRIPGSVKTDLAPGKTWKIEVDAPGYWYFPRIILSGMEKDLSLRLVRTGILAGKADFDGKSTLLKTIEVRFSEKDMRQGAFGQRGVLDCPLGTDQTWSCALPAGTWDLRLRAPAYIPHYFWDQKISSSDITSLGAVQWFQGASLAGWVRTEDSTPLSEACRISLESSAHPASEGHQAAQISCSVPASRSGFFQFDALAPGTYRLQVSEPGFATTIYEQVLIRPHQEATFNQPILLQRPMTATFQILPRTTLEGKAWQIELFSGLPAADRAMSGQTDERGFWVAEDLVPGSFQILIKDELGDRKVFEEIEVYPDAEFIYEISTIWVDGQIRLGDEAIPAQLYFGGRQGAVSTRMDAGEDGLFTGILPREGAWRVDVLSREHSIFRSLSGVEVDTKGGSVSEIEIELPDTSIELEVVDEQGKAYPGARVLLMRKTAPIEAPSWGDSNREGRLELRGLGFAEYSVEAHVLGPRALSSETQSLQLDEANPSVESRLVLRKKNRLLGRVISSIGVGVPGAQVETSYPLTTFSPGLLSPEAQTDSDGRFEIEFPAQISRVELIIKAPGYVLQTKAIATDGAEELVIPLSLTGGGSLILDASIGSMEHPEEFVSIIHEEVSSFGIGSLVQWARANGEVPDRDGKVVVPFMPIGSYKKCQGVSDKVSCKETLLYSGQLASF